jgi:hypothetical protein
MQRAIQTPQVLTLVILGLVVLFVVSTDYFVRRRARRRVSVDSSPDDSTPVDTPPENSAQEVSA